MVVMNMRKVHVFFACCLLLIMVPWSAFANVTARIDRESMAIDETLTLVITKDGSSFFVDPDLEPLQKDFRVLGQSQSSNTRIINGSKSSSVEWQISLAPLRTGKLDIVPIEVGKEKTNPLSVQVQASQPRTKAENVPIFLETDLDAESVYVQSQVILTLRIFWAVEARINEPSDPDIAGALVKTLDADTTYDKMIDGRAFKVFERKYAVFPQQSGVLTIPSQVVDVMIPSRQRSRSIFDQFTLRGEQVKLRSETETINVLEKPAEYPSSAVWLPASQLIIRDQWTKGSQQMDVGESTTLTLYVTADGLMGEQLPPIELSESEGLKLYQGKAEVENSETALGVVGIRTESIAIIPTRSGSFELPEIRIPWWNKITEKVEYAAVPARQLIVKGAPTEKMEQESTSFPDPEKTSAVSEKALQQSMPEQKQTFWMVLCSLLAAGWLVTLYLLVVNLRRKALSVQQEKQKNLEKYKVQEKKAFDLFAGLCRKNDAPAARKAVILWLKIFWPETRMQTLSDVEKVFSETEFVIELHKLDRILYDPQKTSEKWLGKNLLEQGEAVRAAWGKKKSEKNILEDLYK